ncbi:MAG: MFS transporter [Deltaproteobacteria bacterium]|nr:MFS transporter [Deltaproteobacteria bacterium]
MNFKRLLPIYLGAAIGPMGGVGVITLLPVLAKVWNISIQWISLTITLYMVPYIIFLLFSGPIAHIFNTRKTLLFGFGVYALGGLLSGFSPSFGTLVAARFIQGFGAAFIAPILMALVGEMVNPRHLGKAMGLLGVMYTVGVTMGPLISGVLEVYFGWPWFFFFLMALALAVGAFYWATSTEARKTETGSGRISDALVLIKRSYSYPDLRFVSFAAFSLFLGYIGLMTFVADHLKISFYLPSDRIGLVLSMTGFFGILFSPIAGILGDRFGRKPVAYAGMGGMVASILILGSVEYTYEKYIILFSLFGAGSATAWTSLNTLAVQVIPDLRKPAISVYNSFKFTGYALAPLVLSFLYVPFSIAAVHWAFIACILVGLIFTSRMRSLPG